MFTLSSSRSIRPPVSQTSAAARRTARAELRARPAMVHHALLTGGGLALSVLLPPAALLVPLGFALHTRAFARAWQADRGLPERIPSRWTLFERAFWILLPWLGPHLVLGTAAIGLAHVGVVPSAWPVLRATLTWTAVAWALYSPIAGPALLGAALADQRVPAAFRRGARTARDHPADTALIIVFNALHPASLGLLSPWIASLGFRMQAELTVRSIRRL